MTDDSWEDMDVPAANLRPLAPVTRWHCDMAAPGGTNWNMLAEHERLAIMHQHPEWSDAMVKRGHWTPVDEPVPVGRIGGAAESPALDDVLAEIEEANAPAKTTYEVIPGPLGAFWIPAEPAVTRDHVHALSNAVFAGEYHHSELPMNIDADLGRPELLKIASILDIGAGWGAFSVWAHAVWPDAWINAYEPHGAAADLFETNAPFATLRRVAVTDADYAWLSVAEYWGSATTVGKTFEVGQKVAVMRPDDLPPCDLMKLDCEGAEVEVLAGYHHLSDVRVLMLEFHSIANRNACTDIAINAGLRLVKYPDVEAEYGVMVWVR